MNTLTSSILQRIDRILTAGLVLNSASTVKVDLRVDNRSGLFTEISDENFKFMCYGNDFNVLRDISDLTLVLEVSGEKWTLLIGKFRYFALIKDILPELKYDIKSDYRWKISSCQINRSHSKNSVRQIQFFVNHHDLIWFECEE